MPKIKKVSVEKLAELSQKEFASVRDHMEEGFGGVREDIKILRNDVEAGFHEVTQVLKLMREDLHELKTSATELHELRARVEKLERKVGLRR